MQSRSFHALETPIAGRVIQLNKILLNATTLPVKRIQHTYCDTLLKNGSLLFTYAMRQLKGKDYKKRALEVIEEIQAMSYLIYSMQGWSSKVMTSIDVLCDDIASQICRLDSARIIKSKDEDERAC